MGLRLPLISHAATCLAQGIVGISAHQELEAEMEK
jgi:hypothetical protein